MLAAQVDLGPKALVLYGVSTWYEALSFNAPVVASYRGGKLIARTEPIDHEVLF